MTEMNTATALDFESEINNDEYFLVPVGTYGFTIKNVEKGRYQPKQGSKIPACPKVTLTLALEAFDQNGVQVTIQTSLFLASNMKGSLSSFFECIGMKKKGEPLRMSWNIIGKTGYCEVDHREYNGAKYNNFKKWVIAPAQPAAASQPSWASGKF